MTFTAHLSEDAPRRTGTPPRPPAEGVPWLEARNAAHAAPDPLPARRVDLESAAGLTLAEPIDTPVALPAFDTAAMDGFAVAGDGPWQVVGRASAGEVWSGHLAAGDAVVISTGAQVPRGADAVLPVEQAHRDGDRVSGRPQPSRTHIRRRGEDAPAGRRLAEAGVRIGPALLGLAATCGRDALTVRPRPRVLLLVTGDELRNHGVSGGGQVRDAIGPTLGPLVHELGGEVTGRRYVPDRPVGLLAKELGTSADPGREADVVIVSGSTSVGETDQLRQALHSCAARWIVDTVACRPGHPQILARLPDGRWLVGLPGNPFAALASAYTLVAPLLAGLAGRSLPGLPLAAVTGDVRPARGLTRLLPVTWDGACARIMSGHRAAFLHGAALADALAALPPDWTPGAPAPLVLLR
ncbi:molybdopterin molybdotransferase MoeA [Actinopolymorpha pittospori]|uniref:Molybdopterin molybdenumtransferase n=1 Tax=Actinopolymorpha pittospori TaxID=648752 RepID=A0A927MYW7_9ACTN|nr:molybdopterin molybdotransferase MoeA [Actinopolymorpha pittospori]MBE1605862.1 molybdopterin molybdotransferase [Actinopolymorpha pittospori]